jgi:N-acetylmuramoyl-L-alanine amidase
MPTRRDLLRTAVLFMLALVAIGASFPAHASLSIGNRLSPLNSKRPRRPQTLYIVLHTTEGEEAGSLDNLIRFGEAHYFVARAGRVYRIIDKSKIATHAGRSMWEGRTTIDNYSIGIEVSGYHNRDISNAQYVALRELLGQLKNLYGIADENVLTHSMVAYGRPNRFHDDNHRGRKRCGMIFAKPEVRARLGLESKPQRDLDVAAGRLKVADKELFKYLFASSPKPVLVAANSVAAVSVPALTDAAPESTIIDSDQSAWQIARERYNDPSTIYVLPDGSRVEGNRVRDWTQLPAGTRVILSEMEDTQPFEGFLEIGKDGDTSKAVAGMAYASATTIYFFPDGLIRTGAELKKRRSTRDLLENPPQGTRVLVGYVYGGHVKTKRPPSRIAGVKWNYPSTYYRYPDGTILSGDDISTKAVPAGTLIVYQQ